MGRVKQKSGFEHVQNVQIHILCMSQGLSQDFALYWYIL